MPPPKKVHVSPLTYTVRPDSVAVGVANATGATLSDDLLILYDEKRPPGIQRDTMVHESLHAIWKQTYLRYEYDDEADGSPGERIIAELAPRLVALLRDNPKLVAYLTEGS